MSSNIYEEPNFNMKVRYSKGVTAEERGQRVERIVDIYECGDDFKDNRVETSRRRVDVSTRSGETDTQRHLPAAQKNYFKVFTLVLGLVCVLLIFGVIALSTLYFYIILENKELSSKNKELEENFNSLNKSYNRLNDTECQSQGTGWRKYEYSCYYTSSEMKNWTESRKDCQSRGADLVMITNREENDFVKELSKHGKFWIGLQSVKKGTQKYWEWRWVDKKTRHYTCWSVGEKAAAQEGQKVYIDQSGTWKQTTNGSMQWICEKYIYESLIDALKSSTCVI